MKRHIALLLTMLMVVSALVGCGSSSVSTVSEPDKSTTSVASNLNTEGYPIVNDKITLKMMGSKAAITGPWDQLVLFTEMEKKTNIHFEFDTPSSENYTEKKGISFASNDLPDVFNGGNLTASDEINYGSQGMLIPLEKLIEQYAPNFKKLMDANPNLKRSITTLDGHIYSLPYMDDTPRSLVSSKMWINQDWVKNVNMEMPETMDELYSLLKAFKEKDPNKNGINDEIPLSFDRATMDYVRQAFLSSYGLIYSGSSINAGKPRVDVKDDKVIYVPIEEGYKEYLKFMNKLFNEKLMDAEAFTQTSQQMTANGNAGKIGLFGNAGSYLTIKKDDYPKYTAMPVLTSSINSTKMWPKEPGMYRGIFAITNKNKYPEATIRWIDYFYSEEGGTFLSQGPEGLGWKWTDSSKTAWEKILPPEYNSTEEYRGGKITPNAGTATGGKIDGQFILKLNAPHVQFLEKEVAEKYKPYLRDVFPLIYFKDDEQKRITALETDLNKYIDQMEARFITGDAKIDTWNEYISTVKKMGSDEMIALYQTSYDCWKNVK